MKSIYLLALCFAFFQSSFSHQAIAQTNTSELTPFSVSIELTEKGAKLVCYNGCNWEKTSYKNQNAILIDFSGVSENNQVAANLPFGFIIEKKGDGVLLTSKKGTRWTTLTIPCAEVGCMFQVNQLGLVL